MRHSHQGKIVPPVPWSPLQDIDWRSARQRRDPQELTVHGGHGVALQGGRQAYLAKAGTLYDTTLSSQKEGGLGIIELEAAFEPVSGPTGPLR